LKTYSNEILFLRKILLCILLAISASALPQDKVNTAERPESCETLFRWFGSRRESYRAQSVLPTFYDKTKLRVVLFAEKSEVGWLQEILHQIKSETIPGFNEFDFDIAEMNALHSEADFKRALQSRTKEADVVFLLTHSNPVRLKVNPDLLVSADVFEGVDLKDKTVVLSGCSSGGCFYPGFMADASLHGEPIPIEDRIAEGIMRNTGAAQAVGSIRKTDPNDIHRLLTNILLYRGGTELGGYKTYERPLSPRARLGDDLSDLKRLRDGSADEKVRYVQTVEAWRKQMASSNHSDVEPDFETFLWEWGKSDKTPFKLRVAILDHYFQHEPSAVGRVIAHLENSERERIIEFWLTDPEHKAYFDYHPLQIIAFSAGLPQSQERIARKLSAAHLRELCKYGLPNPPFQWQYETVRWQSWGQTLASVIRQVPKEKQ